MDELAQPEPLKRKVGRPKGSKTRPRWLRPPKRPRGRPPGSKNKPKTLQAFFEECLEEAKKPPPPRIRKPGPKHDRPREYYVEISRKAKLKKQEVNGCVLGQPKGWHKREFLQEQAKAEREARRMMKIMEDQGQLPEMDDLAKEALLSVLTMMRQPCAVKDKHSLARTILEYTKAKPASKSDVTVRTAEDWLDDLSESNG